MTRACLLSNGGSKDEAKKNVFLASFQREIRLNFALKQNVYLVVMQVSLYIIKCTVIRHRLAIGKVQTSRILFF